MCSQSVDVCVFQEEYVVAKIDPVVTEEEFDKLVTPILLEYFDHGMTKEVEVGGHLKHHALESR